MHVLRQKWTICWLLVLCQPAAARELESTSRRDFFEQHSGKIAVFADARHKKDAKDRNRFLFFPGNGEYQLTRRFATLWFAVNHIVKPDVAETTSDDEAAKEFKPTYLGVQIISHYEPPFTPSAKLYFFRNRNWVRESDSSFPSGAELSKAFANRTIEEFFSLSKDQSTTQSDNLLQQFDSRFAKWHAQVSRGIASSWDFKENWIVNNIEVNQNLFIKNYLIRFTPNTSGNTNRILLFSTGVGNQKKMRIRTFAPTVEGTPDLFDNDVTIAFR